MRIRRINTYQVQNSMNWIRGTHAIKFGGEARYVQANILQTAATQGSFSFDGRYTSIPVTNPTGNGLAEFLLGIPSGTGVSVGINLVYPRRRAYALFLQDDWKVTPNLTLNLGLRYELNMPTTDARGQLSGFDHDTGEIVYPKNAVLGDFFRTARPDLKYRFYDSNTIFDPDYNNFGPRVGFAYKLPGLPKTVFRSGFGLFYMSPELNSEMNTGNTPPFQLRIDEAGNQRTPNLSWALKGDPALLRTAQFGIFTFNANRDFTTGYILQWTGEFQHELPKGTVVKAGYVGSKGSKIDFHVVRNQLPPGPGAIAVRRRFNQFARIRSYESSGWTSYHSLQTSVERRYSSGFHFLGAYTWAKAMDHAWTQDACCQQDIDNLAAEKGLAPHDVRHRFTSNVIYELPFGKGKRWGAGASRAARLAIEGWQLGVITALQTGNPGNVSVAGNLDNVPDNNDRPDRVGNGSLPNPTPDRWWDPAAFRPQRQFTFGNSGRHILTRPGLVNFDFITSKSIPVREQHRLELRFEFFNATNTPSFGGPSENISNANFGRVFSAGAPRQIQLGIKYYF